MEQKHVAVWIACLAVVFGAQLAMALGQPMNISGKWQIDRELSDDPGEVMREQMEKMRDSRSGRTGYDGGGRSGGSRGGYSGSGGSRPDRAQMEERLREFDASRAQMEIIQDGEELMIIYAGGDTVSVTTDGVRRTRETALGEAAVTAYWEDFVLVITREIPDRPQLRRRYEITDAGNLQVTMEVVTPDGAQFEIRSIYAEIPGEQ